MSYANVAFPLAIKQQFTYTVPPQLDSMVQPGVRVLAPFHRSTQEGVVVERVDETELPPHVIKNISDCLDKEPMFSSDMLALTKWMADYYVSSWGNALFCAVPAAVRSQKQQRVKLKQCLNTPRGKVQKEIVALLDAEGELSPNQLARRVGVSYSNLRPKISALREKGIVDVYVTHKPKATAQVTTVATLIMPASEIETEIAELKKEENLRRGASAKHAEILQILLDEAVPLATAEITKRVRAGASLLRTLERRGFIQITRAPSIRNPLSTQPVTSTQPHPLNSAQSDALYKIQNTIATKKSTSQKPPVLLLHGVTGSGKTEVYMQAIAPMLQRGKSVIVLVPEISLTPQTAARFIGRFGERVAVLHSRLSYGERYDEWYRIQNGEATIVIGPRSAVFAPVKELGLLVIDEEHSDSYKSDTAPRYHAREVAQKRSELENCPLLLGSATPSLESFHHARKGTYHLLSLPSRVLKRKMPTVHIVDMRDELKRGNRTIFSDALRIRIEERLVKREQIILFLNRRGHSTYVFCRNCGYVEQCNKCAISLTFHFETKKLVCHHCGYKRNTHATCPQCSSPAIRYFGMGTEAIEQEVRKSFPVANVKRFDADSTARKNAHQQILAAFQQQQLDILIGTQMIAKGLDFPNVTLVGVIAADTALNLPDFRACEQTFSLLTQVAGRSGRSDIPGEVIIQSYMPDNYCITAAQKHDYIGFYQKEVEGRSALRYPPFSYVARLLLRGPDEKEVIAAAHALLNQLQYDEKCLEIDILGPAPAPLSKIEAKFRWHFLLRSQAAEKISQLLHHVTKQPLPAIKNGAIELIIDINPTNTL